MRGIYSLTPPTVKLISAHDEMNYLCVWPAEKETDRHTDRQTEAGTKRETD